MQSATFAYESGQETVHVAYDTAGEGLPVLLLPALSSVSTRREVRQLADALSDTYGVVTTDWPGLGDGRQPRLDYTPSLLLGFLEAFVDARFGGAAPAVVAAGHAAAYALALAKRRRGIWRQMVLIAPTWRGPLPTMMGGYRPLQRYLRALFYLPILGPLLYRMNVATPVIRMMYRGHVYADARHLTPALLREKCRVARRPGGRYASVSFVTGALDPVHSREEFLALVRAARAPLMVVTAPQIPPRSRAEIEALADVAGIVFARVPAGALGVHEEFAASVAATVRSFLLA